MKCRNSQTAQDRAGNRQTTQKSLGWREELPTSLFWLKAWTPITLSNLAEQQAPQKRAGMSPWQFFKPSFTDVVYCKTPDDSLVCRQKSCSCFHPGVKMGPSQVTAQEATGSLDFRVRAHAWVNVDPEYSHRRDTMTHHLNLPLCAGSFQVSKHLHAIQLGRGMTHRERSVWCHNILTVISALPLPPSSILLSNAKKISPHTNCK